jgi:hypothetical protein
VVWSWDELAAWSSGVETAADGWVRRQLACGDRGGRAGPGCGHRDDNEGDACLDLYDADRDGGQRLQADGAAQFPEHRQAHAICPGGTGRRCRIRDLAPFRWSPSVTWNPSEVSAEPVCAASTLLPAMLWTSTERGITGAEALLAPRSRSCRCRLADRDIRRPGRSHPRMGNRRRRRSSQ